MTNIALLAPVPLEHLVDGTVTCRLEGKVAFGSRAWETFRELDMLRGSSCVPVLIYASWAGADGPATITWSAKYIGHVEGKNGAHPEGMRFRPPSTALDESDNKGWWAVFWEVADLTELSPAEHRVVKNLRSRSGKYYKPEFVPEGPLIIEAP